VPAFYVIDRGFFQYGRPKHLTATSGTTTPDENSTASGYPTQHRRRREHIDHRATSGRPRTGAFSGPHAPNGPDNKLAVGIHKHHWAIYFPKQNVTYAGGSNGCVDLHSARCLYPEVQRQFTFNSNCGAAGTAAIGTTSNQLVE